MIPTVIEALVIGQFVVVRNNLSTVSTRAEIERGGAGMLAPGACPIERGVLAYTWKDQLMGC